MSGDAKDNAAKPGGGKKLLIMGLAAGLLVGGGGAAAFFLFLKPKEEPAAEKPAEAAQPEPASFVKLDRLSAPLQSGDIVVGYVLLDLSLEVKTKNDELLVVQKLPAVRAAFLREVTNTPIGKPDQPLVVDFDGLTARLKETANRELGRAAVSRVLVLQSTRT